MKIFARILREAADIVLQLVGGFALFAAASDAMRKQHGNRGEAAEAL